MNGIYSLRDCTSAVQIPKWKTASRNPSILERPLRSSSPDVNLSTPCPQNHVPFLQSWPKLKGFPANASFARIKGRQQVQSGFHLILSSTHLTHVTCLLPKTLQKAQIWSLKNGYEKQLCWAESETEVRILCDMLGRSTCFVMSIQL